MKNTMNNKQIQEVATAIMNDMRASGANPESMDDLYKAVSKYAQLPRAKFDEVYNKIQNRDFSAEGKAELSEVELDTVVGGFEWKTLGIIVGCLLAATAIMTGLGALGGLGYAWLAPSAFFVDTSLTAGVTEGVMMWGLAASSGAIMGGGMTFGAGACTTGLVAFLTDGFDPSKMS